MGNLVLNIGPVSLTVAPLGCATFLLWDRNPEWTKFFNLAVYSGVWSMLWSAAQFILRRTTNSGRRETAGQPRLLKRIFLVPHAMKVARVTCRPSFMVTASTSRDSVRDLHFTQ